MLTEQDIEQYNRDGYLVIPDLFTAKECEIIKGYGSEAFNKDGQFHIKNTCLDHEECLNIATQEKMKNIVNQLSANPKSDSDVAIMSDVLLYRPGGQPLDHESVTHQDYTCSEAIQPHDCKMVACVYLDDADENTGHLYYYPGTHVMGELQYDKGSNGRYFLSEQKTQDIIEKYGEVVHHPAKAGTVIMHDIWSVHGATLNISDRVRQSWIVNYIIQDIYQENNGKRF